MVAAEIRAEGGFVVAGGGQAAAVGRQQLRGRLRIARVAHRDELEAALEALLAADDAAAWAARLLAVGVPAGTVNGIGEALALARRLGLAPTVGVGEGHPEQLAHPVRYSGFAPAPPTAPPALDADGQAVRAWLAEG